MYQQMSMCLSFSLQVATRVILAGEIVVLASHAIDYLPISWKFIHFSFCLSVCSSGKIDYHLSIIVFDLSQQREKAVADGDLFFQKANSLFRPFFFRSPSSLDVYEHRRRISANRMNSFDQKRSNVSLHTCFRPALSLHVHANKSYFIIMW